MEFRELMENGKVGNYVIHREDDGLWYVGLIKAKQKDNHVILIASADKRVSGDRRLDGSYKGHTYPVDSDFFSKTTSRSIVGKIVSASTTPYKVEGYISDIMKSLERLVDHYDPNVLIKMELGELLTNRDPRGRIERMVSDIEAIDDIGKSILTKIEEREYNQLRNRIEKKYFCGTSYL